MEITYVPSESPSVSTATNVTEDMDMAAEGEYFWQFSCQHNY